MKFPGLPRDKQSLKQHVTEIVNYLRAITPRPSSTIKVSETANGTILDVNIDALAQLLSGKVKPNGGTATTTGAHLDLTIQTIYVTVDIMENQMMYGGVTATDLYRWRHGLYVGKFEAGADPLQGDSELTIDTANASYLEISGP